MKTTGTIDRAGRVRLEQGRKRVRAYLAGNVVADTTQPRLVWEVPYYPAYYFPVEDVRTDLLVPTATVSHSPSRGDAQHFTIEAGSREAEDAALRYVDSPIEELRDLIRLDWDAMDGWFEEDEEVYTHPRDPYTRVDILATSRRVRAEHVEVSALALHLLQSSLVLINTRLLDRVLEEPVWAQRMTEHDRRGLSPLFWSNVALYGRWHLDMDQRIDFDRGPDTDGAGPGAGESYNRPPGPRPGYRCVRFDRSFCRSFSGTVHLPCAARLMNGRRSSWRSSAWSGSAPTSRTPSGSTTPWTRSA